MGSGTKNRTREYHQRMKLIQQHNDQVIQTMNRKLDGIRRSDFQEMARTAYLKKLIYVPEFSRKKAKRAIKARW